MTAISFDSNILIDALNGHELAREEIRRADVPCISRVTWIEVLSKVEDGTMPVVIRFLTGFTIDELDADIADRAAQLRRERTKLKLADAVILASAQAAGRMLVTRNTKDFPETTPGIRVPYRIEQ
ncbi:type II toxin-antitoxin system VapC family toxin [Sphingomonas populi]|uniref:Type II toxin-antitoxin system VapC family toxin n=1 Tax=Sphingomonas populi TaxID=2484750 RepID=A0A4Q6Y0K4_9SPHN|nr:type II toxin-antitoxin system VapC family toxin [Sphingomonas populi]RZF65801.1 type II toxin-antitoxin system VapC family toxin [Sphingomonas populi]